jgi:DNA-binding beta-propeller fold protein YncE
MAWAGPVVIVDDDLAGGNRLHLAVSVAVSPDGRHIYVGATEDNVVTAFSVLLFRDGVELGTTEAWSSQRR